MYKFGNLAYYSALAELGFRCSTKYTTTPHHDICDQFKKKSLYVQKKSTILFLYHNWNFVSYCYILVSCVKEYISLVRCHVQLCKLFFASYSLVPPVISIQSQSGYYRHKQRRSGVAKCDMKLKVTLFKLGFKTSVYDRIHTPFWLCIRRRTKVLSRNG